MGERKKKCSWCKVWIDGLKCIEHVNNETKKISRLLRVMPNEQGKASSAAERAPSPLQWFCRAPFKALPHTMGGFRGWEKCDYRECLDEVPKTICWHNSMKKRDLPC